MRRKGDRRSLRGSEETLISRTTASLVKGDGCTGFSNAGRNRTRKIGY